jgi:YceI-like protein
MSLTPGTHRLGPDNATLRVATTKTGAAAVAGHNLVIEVGSWKAVLSAAAEIEITLTADSHSLRVLEGSGGITPLGDDDKANIEQTIDTEVLKGNPISFRSTSVTAAEQHLDVEGELELGGERHPLSFALELAPDGLSGNATVRQSAWSIKPYSALFGTLKVGDDVEVSVIAKLADG